MRLLLIVVLAGLSSLGMVGCTSDDPPGGGSADRGAAAADGGPGGTIDGMVADDAAGPGPTDATAADADPTADASAADADPTADAAPTDADPTADAAPADGGPADAAPTADAAPSSDAVAGADANPGADAAPAPDAVAGVDAGATFDATFTVDVGPRAPDAAPGPDRGPPGDGGPSGADAANLCTANSDCIAGVEVCGRLVVENNVVVSRCGQPNPSPPANDVGGACTMDSQCASNLCLDGIANECTQVCRDSATDCPAGFSCAAYQYTPGNVWIPTCGRSCADDDDCAISPANVCSTTTFATPAGPYELATVCQVAAGTVPLGGACATPDDCRSGICFTTSRVAVGCAACGAGEACQCAGGGAPPCAGGVLPDCVLRACTALCDDPTDCASGGALTRCSGGINLRLPDGQTRPISACARP